MNPFKMTLTRNPFQEPSAGGARGRLEQHKAKPEGFVRSGHQKKHAGKGMNGAHSKPMPPNEEIALLRKLLQEKEEEKEGLLQEKERVERRNLQLERVERRNLQLEAAMVSMADAHGLEQPPELDVLDETAR